MHVPVNPVALTDGEVRETLILMAQAITSQARAITSQDTREGTSIRDNIKLKEYIEIAQ